MRLAGLWAPLGVAVLPPFQVVTHAGRRARGLSRLGCLYPLPRGVLALRLRLLLLLQGALLLLPPPLPPLR